MTHSLTNIRYVLFDAVGTLIYPDPPVAEVYCEFGQRHGSALTESQIEARFQTALDRHCDSGPTSEHRERSRWRDIVSEVFVDVPQARQDLFEALWLHFAEPQHWALFPDVAPAWTALATAGFKLGVASNFDQRLTDICQQLPPLNLADRVFHSAAIGHAKPSVEFFTAIEQQLQLPPEALLMVGDRWELDVAPAVSAGWTALRIDRQRPSSHVQTISSLTQLAEDR